MNYESWQFFTQLCDAVAATTSRIEKKNIIANATVLNADYNGDICLLFKLLAPEFDTVRAYNIGDTMLVRHLSSIINEQCPTADVRMELNAIVQFVEAHMNASAPPLSLADVDAFLDAVSNNTAGHDGHKKLLMEIMGRCRYANDFRYVIGVLRRNLRTQARANTVLLALHAEAPKYYDYVADLSAVVLKYYRTGLVGGGGVEQQGSSAIEKFVSQVGAQVGVMLAEPCKTDNVFKRVKNDVCVETKYDGERVQVHYTAAINDLRFYSRTQKQMADAKIGQEVREKLLSTLRQLAVDVILDCELVLVDRTSGVQMPFGSLGVHRKRQYANARPQLFVFDVLHYAECVCDWPFERRRALLERLFAGNDTITPSFVFGRVAHGHTSVIVDYLAEARRQRLEGLMVKDVMGKYEPGKRRWIKVKFGTTFDLLLVGACFGKGKYAGVLSSYLFAIESPDRPGRLLTVTYSTGLTDELRKEVNAQCMNTMRPTMPDGLPHWLHCANEHTPDMVARQLDDDHVFVWAVGANDVTFDSVHTSTRSLRFPTMECRRDDKRIVDANKVSELKMPD